MATGHSIQELPHADTHWILLTISGVGITQIQSCCFSPSSPRWRGLTGPRRGGHFIKLPWEGLSWVSRTRRNWILKRWPGGASGQSSALLISLKNSRTGTSLVAQWLRICLPMQRTRVRALVWEDPTCRGATKPMRHSYWACVLEPASHNYWAREPQLLSLPSATREATAMKSPSTAT